MKPRWPSSAQTCARERVAAEPAFERFVERGTGLRPLRGVQVQVGEAGQEDLAVGEAGEPVKPGQFGADSVILRVVRGEDGRDDAVGADEIQRLRAIRDVGGMGLVAIGLLLGWSTMNSMLLVMM